MSIGPLTTPVLIGLSSLIIITVLEARKIKGAILIGIVIATVLGVIFGEVTMPEKLASAPPSIAPIAFKLSILAALKWGFIGAH